jgi:Flp pilus assembly pilin Flp
MKSIVSLFRALHADDSGAAFIEYTALLGVILAVGLAVLGAVGVWVGDVWTKLCSASGLGATGTTCTP